MPVKWMDVTNLSFNTLLLLERIQLTWFPGWVPEPEMAVSIHANPVIEWYIRNKCPELNSWLDRLLEVNKNKLLNSQDEIRQSEETILKGINDLVVYVVNPEVYDAQPFLDWDDLELTSLVDLTGKRVIDVGAGTGRLTFIAAKKAYVVYAVDPVANLRLFIKNKAREERLSNVFPIDGLIEDIPFEDNFADVTMGGHVFGEYLDEEYCELMRVTKQGGIIILCPGNVDKDDEKHSFLIEKDFSWSVFEEPGAGKVRKYWKTVPAD
jgi:SAM-dependent methyltransferase